MMMCWRGNECMEEDDDYCGVGDDGGLKWRENERWGWLRFLVRPRER